MSKRLQVLIDAKEYRLFAQIARAKGMSLGEWVRQELRRGAQETSVRDPDEKMRRLRRLAEQCSYPTGEIDEMLADIEKGRAS
jgi:hypothetical protein